MTKSKLLDLFQEKYTNNAELEAILEKEGIEIIKEYIGNWKNIQRFHDAYYQNCYPKTVLCGINPGRNGAGKTGIAFVDFDSLSKMLSGIDSDDKERSAQFFYEIVEHFGAERFFETFYVTNISWVGFIKDGKNINYYDLPPKAQEIIFEIYQEEIALINPKTIISIGAKAQETNTSLFGIEVIDKDAKYITSHCMQHPNYCAFPSNRRKCKESYLLMLSQFVRKNKSIQKSSCENR